MLDDLDLTIADSIFDIDPDQWDVCAGSIPLVRHGFFRALELSGSLSRERGVVPKYVTLRDRSGVVLACAPGMLKWGNKREFGPEIRWLGAGLTAGCFEWPKFQIGIPFFPRVTPKLLLHPEQRNGSLGAWFASALRRLATRPDGLSAFNVMHVPAETAAGYVAQGALLSRECRSVWRNPGVGSFDEYLRLVPRRKRKKWRAERREAHSHGLRFDVVGGADVSEALLADFYRGFEAVCARHGNPPWLPAELFGEFCRQIPESVALMTARDGDRYCAGAFRFVGGGKLYNDSWSAPEPPPPGLLFEMACYQPIEYAIDQGLDEIDSGLHATYKSERGYSAEPVFNAHWFYNERLAAMAAETLQDSSE